MEARVASETPTVATVPGSAGREVPRAHSGRFLGSSRIVSTPQGLVLDPPSGRRAYWSCGRASSTEAQLLPQRKSRTISELQGRQRERQERPLTRPRQAIRVSVECWPSQAARKRHLSDSGGAVPHRSDAGSRESLGLALPSRSISQISSRRLGRHVKTRTLLSKSPSRPAWNVSPRASKTSGASLRSAHVWSFADQTQQGHVLGGIQALVQQSSQASGHSPRPAPVAAGVNAARAQTWPGATPTWRPIGALMAE